MSFGLNFSKHRTTASNLRGTFTLPSHSNAVILSEVESLP
jgi:hypothetical protein